MSVDAFFSEHGWDVVETLNVEGRQRVVASVADLHVPEPVNRLLQAWTPEGVYGHQRDAIQHCFDRANVCMTTSTASGKSLVFYAAAIKELVANRRARAIAIYPLKALGRQQEERWAEALATSGLGARAGRIDGGVPVARRAGLLKNCSVITMTPDVMHAWLLPNAHTPAVSKFLRGLSLVVVDEVHTYTGVFGSNAALLFRRLQHLLNCFGASPAYIGASATIAEPEMHLQKLFGFDFEIVGQNADTSGQFPLEITLVDPPEDPLTDLPKLMTVLSTETSSRFITFVDSRKQTEQLSSIVARAQDDEGVIDDHLQQLHVLPYRAGYEERDRQLIQKRLVEGSLRGVVSTSALELGIDIPEIDVGVLLGVPASSTSLQQRIGRVGRHCEGRVVIVNRGSIYDDAVFSNPKMLLERPPTEGALYLENPRIQYIHALCLARHDGEHDLVAGGSGSGDESTFESDVSWPEGFVELCNKERVGEVPPDLQSMKLEAGDDPAHTFPLRDVESQFKVELKQGPDRDDLGSLSHSQLMREAYPGAVYYYTTRPFRVSRVFLRSKTVSVRREKHYTTSPQALPTLVFPNLTEENIHACMRHGELIAVECNLQIRESNSGFKERRGPNEFAVPYPMDSSKTGVYFDPSRFTRNYFTTGVVLTHPALSEAGVDCGIVASLLYEALLFVIPFERQDVSFAADRHRRERGPLGEGSRFVAIHDQTYGSLRLSGRLLEDGVLETVMDELQRIVSRGEAGPGDEPTAMAALALAASLTMPPADCLTDFHAKATPMATEEVRVVCPGSRGIYLAPGNEVYEVEGVFFDPSLRCLCYRGSTASSGPDKLITPIDRLAEIPGESSMGSYNYQTGEIRTLEGEE